MISSDFQYIYQVQKRWCRIHDKCCEGFIMDLGNCILTHACQFCLTNNYGVPYIFKFKSIDELATFLNSKFGQSPQYMVDNYFLQMKDTIQKLYSQVHKQILAALQNEKERVLKDIEGIHKLLFQQHKYKCDAQKSKHQYYQRLCQNKDLLKFRTSTTHDQGLNRIVQDIRQYDLMRKNLLQTNKQFRKSANPSEALNQIQYSFHTLMSNRYNKNLLNPNFPGIKNYVVMAQSPRNPAVGMNLSPEKPRSTSNYKNSPNTTFARNPYQANIQNTIVRPHSQQHKNRSADNSNRRPHRGLARPLGHVNF